MRDLSQPMPLELLERMMLAIRDIVDLHIRCELLFDHVLDGERLQQAFQRLAGRYPFLAMGVDLERERPAFVPLPAAAASSWVRRLEPQAFESFLAGPHDCHRRHSCGWASSTRRADRGRPSLFRTWRSTRPARGSASASSRRSTRPLAPARPETRTSSSTPSHPHPSSAKSRGIRATLTSVRHFSRLMKPVRSRCAVLPLAPQPALFWKRESWNGESVRRLKQAARSEGGTLNDLFAAAILTAVSRLHPEQSAAAPRIGMTADLRRFVTEPLLRRRTWSSVVTLTVDRPSAPHWRTMLGAVSWRRPRA